MNKANYTISLNRMKCFIVLNMYFMQQKNSLTFAIVLLLTDATTMMFLNASKLFLNKSKRNNHNCVYIFYMKLSSSNVIVCFTLYSYWWALVEWQTASMLNAHFIAQNSVVYFKWSYSDVMQLNSTCIGRKCFLAFAFWTLVHLKE